MQQINYAKGKLKVGDRERGRVTESTQFGQIETTLTTLRTSTRSLELFNTCQAFTASKLAQKAAKIKTKFDKSLPTTVSCERTSTRSRTKKEEKIKKKLNDIQSADKMCVNKF